MSALRQRAAHLARRSRPTAIRNTRSYASGHGHDSHHAAPKDEPLGAAFYLALGAIPLSIFFYTISRPGEDGKESAISSLIGKYTAMQETWSERNALRTAMVEQAAHDKHLLYNAPRNKHVELKFPEVFHAGSPFNVPAGHNANLDKVVEHYRQQHLDEEERKATKARSKWDPQPNP
ncbi:hypothetical protein CONLIGDRAFT_627620 [Coniochaeta ligniaria NRRL 30616]|uniref:NADH-ubiquinone oxidoreductase 17.8 kDa subunit n=1 Tax=Coniochaeta ligniaria NRRL 30616 TaxID=1408157 RepID=A0A1J7K5R7_9PEZI|nr:hypothetical protein CONLIGDRAFT_627620 [Coniochaeta ligniaria NRRL 30616]